MAPQILGIFCSEKSEKMGAGGTARDFVQKILWFAVQLDEEDFLVYPLNDAHTPLGVTQKVSLKDFISNYKPEPVSYRDHTFPLISAIRDKIGQQGGLTTLAPEEARFVKVLGLVKKEIATDLSAEQLALRLIKEAGAGGDQLVMAQRKNINTFGIALRKEKNFDGAIGYYRKALDLNPEDDHVHFNIARAYFDKGEFSSCRGYLEHALRLNPGFQEAHKFLNHLNRLENRPADEAFPDIDATDVPMDRRRHPRLPLYKKGVKHLCQLWIQESPFKAALIDISLSGARLLLPRELEGKIRVGDSLLFDPRLPAPTGEAPISRPMPVRCHGRWVRERHLGVMFESELDLDLDELPQILAPNAP